MNSKNLIRVGKVSSINYPAGRLRVIFDDKDGIVTDELPMLNFEYEMPAIGESVICLFFGNGTSKGVCLGRYFYQKDLPVEFGRDIFFKRLMRDASIKYDRGTKTYTLTSSNIVFNGNLLVNGNVTINGLLTVTEDAIIGGISFLNHVHPYSWTDPGGASDTAPPK